MTLRRFPFIIICLLAVVWGCGQSARHSLRSGIVFYDGFNQVSLRLDSIAPQMNYLRTSYQLDSTVIRSKTVLTFPVVDHEVGDVTGDGHPEVLLMAFKSTRLDSVRRNRLFIYQFKDQRLHPLWLSSRLPHPLVDFRINNDRHQVRTLEREADGTFLISDYTWGSFGLDWVRFKGRHLSQEQAQKILNNAV